MGDENTPTLGEIGEIFQALKDKGVHRGSALFMTDRIWHEEQQRKEAGR